MFYFFILLNFKPVIIGHTWQEIARRIPLNLFEYYTGVLYMVHVGPTLKIIVRRGFWTSKDIYWGAIVFFQITRIRRSWKSWGPQIFFVSTWNKQEIIGWLQYFTEICVQWQPPCKSTLRSLRVALLVYYNTAVPKGSYNFWLSNTGVTKYCRGIFGNLWNPIPKYGDLIINLFMCFLINQILRKNDFSEI